MKRRSQIVASALCVWGAYGLSTTLQAQEASLTAINALPAQSALGKPFATWVEEVNREGKGIVQITIRSTGSMTPYTMAPAVRDGVVDMAGLPPNYYQNLLPIAEVEKVATNSPKERRQNGTWALLNQLHNEKMKLHYLGTYGWGVPFHIYLRDGKKIEKPDLTGLKIRISPAYRAFFSALGAELLQTAPGDIYQAMERGVIDGFGWPIWDLGSFGLDKVTKYRIDPGFYWTNFGIIVNLAKWQSLTEAQQAFLTRKAIQLDEEYESKAKPITDRFIREQEKVGIQVIRFEGEQAELYLRTAREAAWKEFEKLDPANTAKFRNLLGK